MLLIIFALQLPSIAEETIEVDLNNVSYNVEVKDPCEEVIEAGAKALEAKDLVIQQQDLLVNNLREQRNEAIKQRGVTFWDVLPWTLIGAAAATVIIGVRR